MVKKLLLLSFLFALTILTFNISTASANTETSPEFSVEKDKIKQAEIENLLNNVNSQLEQGETDVYEETYIPEIDETVSIEFSVFNPQNDGIQTMAAAPSGERGYRAVVNGGSFNHTLTGTFYISGGKIRNASQNVSYSGFTFRHRITQNAINKYDPSVWHAKSTVKHEWLGSVGEITGFGYTSRIIVNLYGTGQARIQQANYSSGV